jgi:hypothetical protein
MAFVAIRDPDAKRLGLREACSLFANVRWGVRIFFVGRPECPIMIRVTIHTDKKRHFVCLGGGNRWSIELPRLLSTSLWATP